MRVVELTDDEALTLQLVENAQRENVHPLEEAFAYRALLDIAEPKYDVASIALKVGKSIGHVYGRLRYIDLIEPAAQAFMENRLTAGHALLIARLPQSQQAKALEAAFRSHWGPTEKQVIPVRELSQWIRHKLMLQLEDAIFDREDETLLPEAGSCIRCQKRTGFNTALFDDFQNDDRCLDSACYEAKVSAWLKRQTEQNPALVQISEWYGPQRDQLIIPKSQYIEFKPTTSSEAPERPDQVVCESAATGIVVEGNHVGKTFQICADPACPIHNVPHQQKREDRDEEFERAAEEQRRNLAENLELLNSVLSKVPAVLSRADYEMMIAAWMELLDYEDFECLCERHQLASEDTQADEDIRELSRRHVSKMADAEVSRFLIKLTLLPSGYSSNKLQEGDRLLSAANLYKRSRKRVTQDSTTRQKQKANAKTIQKNRGKKTAKQGAA